MRLRQLFENIARTGEGKTAVVGWGRGMGHRGHMMLASSVITHAKDSEGDPYFVVSRSYGPDDPLEPEEKLDIYRKVFPEQGHIFQTATDELPDLTRVLANLNQQGYTSAIIVVGADQKAAFQYLNHYNGKPDKKGNIPFDFENLQVISRQETKDPSREEEGPRATPMRAVLMDPSKSHDEQFAVWRDAMSSEIDDEEVMALMHKAQQRMTQMAAAKKPKKKVAETTLNEFDHARHVKLLNAHMQKLGYENIGAGTDAQVFAKETGPVKKILMPESGDISTAENSFLAFYNYCQANARNPHLPKFHQIQDNIELDGERFRQITMERLEEVDPEYEDMLVSMTDGIEDGTPLDPQYQPYIKFYQTLKSVMLTGRKLGFENDIITFQSVNIMQRGDTLVIIDPWTGGGGLEEDVRIVPRHVPVSESVENIMAALIDRIIVKEAGK